ncbi:SDR family NAD(P)-dependent oxidoreductase [Rahnella sp. PCH160]|uniref:SDR family NAD(P)-dependent oxidoreductase n=1 Tax=Rahnella sp. PCH160 TaxID=3447928 RepID=UPI0039FDDE9C
MKIFLSIGSGPGIGIATAVRFAREGYRVILTSRNQDYLHAQVKELTDAGYQAEGRFVDAGDISSVVSLVNSVESETGPVEVLHFNSAALHAGTIVDQSVESFIQDLVINIGACFAAVKEASRAMAERKSGSILLAGGIFAHTPNYDYLSLSIGKAGLLNMSNGLFEDFREKNIHIATITVNTLVTAGSAESIGIAEAFWRLHTQEKSDWLAEISYPIK